MAPASWRYVLPMSPKITFFPGRCQAKSPRSQGGGITRRLESVHGRATNPAGQRVRGPVASSRALRHGFVVSSAERLRASARDFAQLSRGAQPSGSAWVVPQSHRGVAFLRLLVAYATQRGATQRQVEHGFVDQLPGTGIPGWGSGSVFWAKLADGRRVEVVADP